MPNHCPYQLYSSTFDADEDHFVDDDDVDAFVSLSNVACDLDDGYMVPWRDWIHLSHLTEHLLDSKTDCENWLDNANSIVAFHSYQSYCDTYHIHSCHLCCHSNWD